MFTMLRRPVKQQEQQELNGPTAKGTPEAPAIVPNKLDPIGASMKFQYGSGDSPLDGYKIKRGVGAGGFGEVYFAESESGKEVALKRIQKNLDVEVRGVRHCLNLRHPNLVAIYDIRFDKLEQGWIVMEFIEGDSLRDRMDRAPQGMTHNEAMQLFSQLAAGVAYLHDQGIVHRDLKPANVFIDGGLVKIGDYGLSKYISASRRGGQTESVGTFHYMAPEIGKGEYGKEIDIYSLGIILYELLTGNVPFDGESSQEIILKHLTADPDLTNVPQPYSSVIQRALAKNPVSRFRDCRDMLNALGWELDASGLAVKSARSNEQLIPPVLQPVSYATPAAGVGAGATPAQPGNYGAKPNGPKPTGAGPTIQQFANANHIDNLYREPVARAIQNAFAEIQVMIRNLPAGPRGIIIAFSIIFLVMNSGFIAPVLFVAFGCYVCYYIVWYLSGGPAKAQAAAAARPQQFVRAPIQPNNNNKQPSRLDETVHYQNVQNYQHVQNVPPAQVASIPKPAVVPIKVAMKQWQSERRAELKSRGFWTRSHQLTRSLTFAGVVIAVLTFAGGMLTVASRDESATSLVGGVAWTGIMTLLTSWTILYLSRRWESRAEDSIVFRFAQMTVGIALGVISFGVSDYLLVPWSEITSGQHLELEVFDRTLNTIWRGFYGENSIPLIAGHIAYFGALMWLVRWWRQADVLRRYRFGMWPIAWSVAMAGLAQGIFYFPGPWCLILAGATSFTVQIASPWMDFNDKEHKLAA